MSPVKVSFLSLNSLAPTGVVQVVRQSERPAPAGRGMTASCVAFVLYLRHVIRSSVNVFDPGALD